MFALDEFRRVENELGIKFTYESAANNDGSNSLCNRFACPERSFFDQDVSGEIVWAHPPYTQIREWQQHYANCKARAPNRTSAMFVVPKWAHFEQYFRAAGYKLFKTYKPGSKLLSAPHSTGERKELPESRWPIQLWWDPPSAAAKLNVLRPGSAHTMTFDGYAESKPVTILVDSGACCNGLAHGFVDHATVKQLVLRKRSSRVSSVRVASGDTTQLLGEVKLRLRMGNHTERVNLLVLKEGVPGVQIILSTDWLKLRAAKLNYQTDTLTITQPSSIIRRTPLPSRTIATS